MSDEEKIEAIEYKLSQMSEDERQCYIHNEQEADRRQCASLSEQLQADIQVIPGDIHHISVNGVTLGYNAFNEWLKARKSELRRQARQRRQESVPSQETTNTNPFRGGWFNN